MVLVSCFTPSHDPRFLDDCYASLQAQTYPDWEWVVLLNNGARWSCVDGLDRRVRIITDTTGIEGVGAAKASAVEECRGEVLVELDHDDTLTPDALAEVAEAFQTHPDAGMVYSQCAPVDADRQPRLEPFAPGHGWRYREQQLADGRRHTIPIAMAATPHNVSYIWYAPNHLRAFTRIAYDKAGGYDRSRTVLDDQDLMCRLFQYGEFAGIDKTLYLQRSHEANTQKDQETNAFIQTETVNLYDRHIEANALAWAGREGLVNLDLGAAHGHDLRYRGVDQHPGSDYTHTFPAPLDLPDSSVGVIRATDFLEHVEDRVAMMNEIHRLLAPGGLLLSSTPSTDGRGAYQDPTHVAFWNSNSFWYYTEAQYAAYVPEITARFQVSRLFNGYPTPWHEAHNIVYVTANLLAIKPGTPRNGGLLHWS